MTDQVVGYRVIATDEGLNTIFDSGLYLIGTIPDTKNRASKEYERQKTKHPKACVRLIELRKVSVIKEVEIERSGS